MEQSVLKELEYSIIEEFRDMKVIKGNEHNFLGMKINLLKNKRFEIDMVEEFKDIAEYFESESKEIIPE